MFFVALIVINVLFFFQTDRENDVTPQLASRELVQCWGASGRKCRNDAPRFAQAKSDQPLLKFTHLSQKQSYGFSIPPAVLKRDY